MRTVFKRLLSAFFSIPSLPRDFLPGTVLAFCSFPMCPGIVSNKEAQVRSELSMEFVRRSSTPLLSLAGFSRAGTFFLKILTGQVPDACYSQGAVNQVRDIDNSTVIREPYDILQMDFRRGISIGITGTLRLLKLADCPTSGFIVTRRWFPSSFYAFQTREQVFWYTILCGSSLFSSTRNFRNSILASGIKYPSA